MRLPKSDVIKIRLTSGVMWMSDGQVRVDIINRLDLFHSMNLHRSIERLLQGKVNCYYGSGTYLRSWRSHHWPTPTAERQVTGALPRDPT